MARLIRWQTILAALGILIVGGLLAQLSFTSQKVTVPIRGGIYTESLVGTPQYLNPLLATSDADRAVASLLFEGLTALQPNGSVSPALAEQWQISPDGTVYTFTLRSGVSWHDGKPVTTADVLFTIELLLSPSINDPNRLADLWSRVQVEALDFRRLRFILERPYAPFLSYTTLPLLPAHLLEEVPPDELRTSLFNRSPIGTGPFQFDSFEEGEDGVTSLYLKANTFYYGQVPYLDGIRFRFYRDEGAALQSLLDGQVDGTFALSTKNLLPQLESSGLTLHRTYLQAYTILFLNTNSSLLQDKRIRQALVAGLDQQALLERLDEEVFAANGPISPISWAYKPDLPAVQHDLDYAVQLLEQAGWRDQNGDGVLDRDLSSLELTLLTRDVPVERVMLARLIDQQLAALGIAVRVVIREDPEMYKQDVENRNYDLLLDGLRQLGRDPDEFVLWHSSQVGSGGANLSSFQNEQVDELLEQGRAVLNRDQRTAAYWQFQEIFVQEAPAVPLFYHVYTYIQNSRINGVELDPLNDLGDRFHSVTSWYVRTEQQIRGRSQPVPRYGGGR